MKNRHLFILIVSFLPVVSVFSMDVADHNGVLCMYSDTIPHVTKHLDLQATSSLLRTCTSYYSNIDKFLRHNTEQCQLLNSADYNKALVSYVQNDNRLMVAYLIGNESEKNKKVRKSVIAFFKWNKKNHDGIDRTVGAYKGINENSTMEKFADLNRAIREGNFLAAKILLENGVDCNKNDECDTPPALFVAFNAGVHMIDLLVAYGANINIKAPTRDYGTPLHSAVYFNNIEIMRHLIRCRANLDAQDKSKRTPLMSACIFLEGKTEAVQLLVDSGADINLTSRSGRTALDIAIYFEYQDVVKLLQEAAGKRIIKQ